MYEGVDLMRFRDSDGLTGFLEDGEHVTSLQECSSRTESANFTNAAVLRFFAV